MLFYFKDEEVLMQEYLMGDCRDYTSINILKFLFAFTMVI